MKSTLSIIRMEVSILFPDRVSEKSLEKSCSLCIGRIRVQRHVHSFETRSRPSSTFRVPSSAKPFICRGKRQTPPATEESSVMGSIDLPFHEGSAGRRLRAHLPLIFARTNRFRVNEACKQTSSTFDRPKFFHFE